MLFDLYDEQATGRLSLRRGGIVKSFDFVGGNPKVAREDSGIVTQADLDALAKGHAAVGVLRDQLGEEQSASAASTTTPCSR